MSDGPQHVLDLPCPDADWAEIRTFALTLDGYEYAKRRKPDADPFEVCSGLAKRLRSAVDRTGRVPAARTIDDLRAARFRWQRAVRWSDTEVPSDEPLDTAGCRSSAVGEGSSWRRTEGRANA